MRSLALALLCTTVLAWRDSDNEPAPPVEVRPAGLPAVWWEPIAASGPALQVVVALHEHDGTGPHEGWERASFAKLMEPLQPHGIALLQVDVRKKSAKQVAAVLTWLREKKHIPASRTAFVATGRAASLIPKGIARLDERLPPREMARRAAQALSRVVLDGRVDAVDRHRRTTLAPRRGVAVTMGPARGGLYFGLVVRPSVHRRWLKAAAPTIVLEVNGRERKLPGGGVWGPPGSGPVPPGDLVRANYEIVLMPLALGVRRGDTIRLRFSLDGRVFAPGTLEFKLR